MQTIVPIPRCDVNVRPATLADIPFIDALQKRYNGQLGFMRTSWLEARIAKGEVLVAEGAGYVIFQDKYHKREELGLIVQLCVDPSKQRGLIGAVLVKAAFDRAAYGCRLFCLWCAQDIEANRFWEAMGFVPLAYRAGSEKKGRVHIFWQKRIREGDQSTPWWYPTETTGGAIGEGRIVLPIPPGKRWSDELPVILPAGDAGDATKKIEGPGPGRSRAGMLAAAAACEELPATRKAKAKVQFGVPTDEPEVVAATPVPVVDEPKRAAQSGQGGQGGREKKSKAKNDPRLVAAARELRDRWLEHVNSGETLLEGAGKYDVARALPDASSSLKALPNAA